MRELERDADAGERLAILTQLGIHKSDTVRQLGWRLVMVEHDGIDIAFLEVGDLGARTRAAVDGNQKLGLVLLQAAREAIRAEAVSFVHPVRKKVFSPRASSAKGA